MFAVVHPQDASIQQEIKQQQVAFLQQAVMMQQPNLYNTALLQACTVPQLEPIPSGNLPPGFDAASCRSVYVGNIPAQVTDSQLAEIFSSVGPLEGCKLIRKEKSSYGFVDFFDHRVAAAALLALNGRPLFGQPIKVNWAYASGQREDTTGQYNVFVGDLSAEVTDATLYAAFSVYPSCSDARVMWDQRTGRSRGFGFVSFRNQADAEGAIVDMNGKWLCSRQVRCNWATKNSSMMMGGAQHPKMDAGTSCVALAATTTSLGPAAAPDSHRPPASFAESFTLSEEKGQAAAPEGHSKDHYTTVYVGNLAHEVSQAELHRHFYGLGAGIIEEVRVQRDKGFGFVRYRTHKEAATAIHVANGRVICGKSVKCSWGSKPTAAAVSLYPNGLPPPPPEPTSAAAAAAAVATSFLLPSLGFTASEFLNFQQQMGMHQQQALGRALLPLPPQQVSGLGVGARMSPMMAMASMAPGASGLSYMDTNSFQQHMMHVTTLPGHVQQPGYHF
eukprot:jgi/Mesen1/3225/ME000187S02393